MAIRSNPEQDANRLLEQMWLNRWGAVELPVDPIWIAASLGIKVFESPMDEDVSGALVNDPGHVPTIFLNSADHVNRQRFTCAHEIGHFYLRGLYANLTGEEFQYVDRRDLLASAGVDPEEMYANRFAAALLMPADHVKQMVEEGMRDEDMARSFKVSLEAMRIRLNNLRLYERS